MLQSAPITAPPSRLRNVPLSIEPPAVRGAVNVAGATAEANSRKPPAVVDDADTAGSCVRIEDGIVNVPAPALVVQMNVHVSETAFVPVPEVVLEEPMISTRSEGLPPVQLSVNPRLRLTLAG